MPRNFLPDTQIEIVREPPRGSLKHALFDFDGTLSLLREGWHDVMAPFMIETISGEEEATEDIRNLVHEYIEESTGIQTIVQMERLVELVREAGRRPAAQILGALEYKAIYNERLMRIVQKRIDKVRAGETKLEAVTLRGALDFLRGLHGKGVKLHIFSGTDRDDVRTEAALLGVTPYCENVWGALNSIEEYSKEKVLKEVMAASDLKGHETLIVGDGPVEIRNAKGFGCVALGVASDEALGQGWNEEKRRRLLKAGADLLVPDFAESDRLLEYLFMRD